MIVGIAGNLRISVTRHGIGKRGPQSVKVSDVHADGDEAAGRGVDREQRGHAHHLQVEVHQTRDVQDAPSTLGESDK